MTKTEERFWSKVKHRPGGCWEWTGAIVIGKGYGRLSLSGKGYLAHRRSYEIEYGPIPNGMYVCHKCDNTLCVNPKHLFLGTQKDNMMDCKTKGRVSKGTNRPLAKLTESQVKVIRKDTRSQREIAKKYNVNQSQISRIKRGKSWKHVR